jgi:hypothetical protein
MITTPASAIDLLGGPGVIASATNRKYTTVSSWHARQSIPVDAWPELIALADGKGVGGISYQTLAEAHAKAKAEKAATPQQNEAA